MNANELADKLIGWADDVYGGGETLIKAAAMLRQQQAELDAFKFNYYNTGYNIQLKDKDETIHQQARRIEELEKEADRLSEHASELRKIYTTRQMTYDAKKHGAEE